MFTLAKLDSVFTRTDRTGGGVGGTTVDAAVASPFVFTWPLPPPPPLGPKVCLTLMSASSTEARAFPTDSTTVDSTTEVKSQNPTLVSQCAISVSPDFLRGLLLAGLAVSSPLS